MKAVNGLVILFLLVAFFGGGWLLAHITLLYPQSLQAQSGQSNSIDVQTLQQRMGLQFVPADAKVQPPITQDQALAKAYEIYPRLKVATGVTPQLGYLSNPAVLKASQSGEDIDLRYADMGLVWVLSFQGIQARSQGKAGSTVRVSNECNVVVNANTGDYIMQFTYR